LKKKKKKQFLQTYWLRWKNVSCGKKSWQDPF